MNLASRLALLAPVLVSLLACNGTPHGASGDGDSGDGGSNGCPSQTVVGTPGTACSDEGQTCLGTVTEDFCGSTSSEPNVQCACTDGTWSCPVAVAGGCPANPSCPEPSQVVPGNSCDTLPQTPCTSNIAVSSCDDFDAGFIQCYCQNSTWECEGLGGPLCPADAGQTCPDPGQVFVGAGCDVYGAYCPGEPQACGGAIVYDTLECDAGQWALVAQTFCDADAGFDGQVGDGG